MTDRTFNGMPVYESRYGGIIYFSDVGDERWNIAGPNIRLL